MSVAALPHFVLLRDGVTHQEAALRIAEPNEIRTNGQALELFRGEPAELRRRQLLAPGPEAQDAFWELGECLFVVDGDGELGPLLKGLALLRGHERLALDAPLMFERRPLDQGGEAMIAELSVDRRQGTYERDWMSFHRRKWSQHRGIFDGFLLKAACDAYGEKEGELLCGRKSSEDRGKLLKGAALAIFGAPFELYSRFVGQRRIIKDGSATLLRIAQGDGGACSEKAQAMRLVADALDVPAQYLLSGPRAKGEVPEEALLEILDTFDVQYSFAIQSYWNHIAVLAEVEGQEVLIDASNGNIPFLWVKGDELAAMLDRRGDKRTSVAHKYVVDTDQLFYHRVSQLVPERLLYALEVGWADPHIDLVQVLDDELGLYGDKKLWLGAIAYRDAEEKKTLQDWYTKKWLTPEKVGGLELADDMTQAEGPLFDALEKRAPRARAAAAQGQDYFEQRLEEANPGEGFRISYCVAARLEPKGGHNP